MQDYWFQVGSPIYVRILLGLKILYSREKRESQLGKRPIEQLSLLMLLWALGSNLLPFFLFLVLIEALVEKNTLIY